MKQGEFLEKLRKEQNATVVQICNTLCVTEEGYRDLLSGKTKLSTFQKIMLIVDTSRPLDDMFQKEKTKRRLASSS